MREDGEPSAKDAAAEWFARLRHHAVSDEDRAAFEAWREADPAHAEAYREMERLWAGLDQIERPAPGRDRGDPARTATIGQAPLRRRLALRRFAIAASVAALACVGAYGLAPPGLLADHRTGFGEQREIVLQDGSTAHLNTASALTVEFTSGSRRVVLQAGEAYFEVAKDSARPFIVEAGSGRIEALGTAFSVRLADDAVEVIVTESRVAVSAPGQDSKRLAAGQGLRFSDSGLGEVAEVDAATALAWRRGRMVFDNQPLGEVLAELARYRQGRILVLDPEVESLPVTGSFSIADTNAALNTIERILPLRLRRFGDLLVLVAAEPAR